MITRDEARRKCPHRFPWITARVIDGEAVLVDPKTSLVRMLNGVGTRVWQLVDGKHSGEQIAICLMREYDVPLLQAIDEVSDFLVELADKELIAF